MEDKAIIELYYARDEQAITESSIKYQNYCYAIAYRILDNREDSEECVLDTWINAWKHIPPDLPESLSIYFGAITRHLAYDRYRKRTAEKRGGEFSLLYDELQSILPSPTTPDTEYENKELATLLKRFLATLPERERNILLCRYFFVYPIKDIAKQNKTSSQHVIKILARIRTKLKDYLEKENYL